MAPQREATPTRYPVAVIGAGALGLSIAARLAQVCPVALIASSPARAAELASAAMVGGSPLSLPVYAAPALPQADWVIVVVKAGATEAASGHARAMLANGVLSLQNGLIEDELRRGCGDGVLAAQGLTTMGAYRDGDRVVPVSVGETLLPAGFEELAALFMRAGMPAQIVADIMPARLAKLLVNLVLNPLTAVFRVRTGELFAPPFPAYVDALVAEAWPVLRRAGLTLDEDAARERVWAVIRSTAQNRTSMLQDVLAGRRTELAAITGAFLRMADADGAAVPTHRALHTLVDLLDATLP